MTPTFRGLISTGKEVITKMLYKKAIWVRNGVGTWVKAYQVSANKIGSVFVESTRSSDDVDSYRDMSGFDPDLELRRFRLACAAGKWKTAATLAANLDENQLRGGPIPIEWLGPECMRTTEDLDHQRDEALERSEK